MNHCDRDGCTALMLSSGTGSEEDAEGNCVDYLLKVLGEKYTNQTHLLPKHGANKQGSSRINAANLNFHSTRPTPS